EPGLQLDAAADMDVRARLTELIDLRGHGHHVSVANDGGQVEGITIDWGSPEQCADHLAVASPGACMRGCLAIDHLASERSLHDPPGEPERCVTASTFTCHAIGFLLTQILDSHELGLVVACRHLTPPRTRREYATHGIDWGVLLIHHFGFT